MNSCTTRDIDPHRLSFTPPLNTCTACGIDCRSGAPTSASPSSTPGVRVARSEFSSSLSKPTMVLPNRVAPCVGEKQNQGRTGRERRGVGACIYAASSSTHHAHTPLPGPTLLTATGTVAPPGDLSAIALCGGAPGLWLLRGTRGRSCGRPNGQGTCRNESQDLSWPQDVQGYITPQTSKQRHWHRFSCFVHPCCPHNSFRKQLDPSLNHNLSHLHLLRH